MTPVTPVYSNYNYSLPTYYGSNYGYYNNYNYGDSYSTDAWVYETDANGPHECTSYERYDWKRRVCYFTCTTDAECTNISNKVDQELNSLANYATNNQINYYEDNTDGFTDDYLLASYKITKGEKITLTGGDDSSQYRKIWDEISALSPDALSDKYLEEFRVYDNPDDDTYAFVYDPDGNGKWEVAVNLSSLKNVSVSEQKLTYIHELGHVISLNAEQVDPNIDENNCQTYEIDEGCTGEHSYIYQFASKFWNNIGQPVYDPSEYVTEYAITNDVEDLAESFAFFVVSGNESTLGNSERDEKIAFFYQYPELVKYRTEMRQALVSEIVRTGGVVTN